MLNKTFFDVGKDGDHSKTGGGRKRDGETGGVLSGKKSGSHPGRNERL